VNASAHRDPAPNHLSPDLSVAVQNYPDLADLIRAWPTLPEPLRAGIMAMVRSSAKGAKA
jgi:hypothetical protein